jgi:DNA invertase Pin-like site-specific DNA recombinase
VADFLSTVHTRERIAVIDDDLGKSGTSSAERQGFQRLIAEIGLGKAGLVLSLDASRLARNNRDWHQLLELCSVFSRVVGDMAIGRPVEATLVRLHERTA